MTTRPKIVPADLTSFVGRRQDASTVRQLLADARLVTLTGTGGVGKTRLAYRVASEMRRAFPDGVCLVELAALEDPALLPHTVLDALAIRDQSSRSATEILAEHLRSHEILLVLDNCEHLVEAVSALARTLLREAPSVKILTTSRQALHVPGEYVYMVRPLRVPDPSIAMTPGTASQYPATTLLAERAAAVVPDFRLTPENEPAVVRLCHQLEGIPLAIELASVRLRLLTVEELADRLDDRFELLREGGRNLPARHQTLQALVDWSYDLCTPSEQTMWARASVFANGFSARALAGVCADDRLREPEVLDTLSGLVDKSILSREQQAGQVRFRMLETLRSYGQVRLAEAGEETDIGRRHRDWCVELVERAGEEWVGPRQQEWTNVLHLEHANLRRALEYCCSEPGQARAGMRLAGVPWFWGGVAHLAEGRHWLERILSLDPKPSRERAWALATNAYIAAYQDDEATVTAMAEEAHRIGLQLGDPATLAYSTHVIGILHSLGDDPTSAIPYFIEARRGYSHSDISPQYVDSLGIELAAAYMFTDQLDEASRVIDELFDQCASNGDRWNLSYALWGRGYLHLLRGDPVRAADDLSEALRIKRTLGDTLGLAMVLEVLAWTASAAGDLERAAVLIGGVERIWQSSGGRLRLFATRRRSYDENIRDVLGDTEHDAAAARGGAMTQGEILAFALRENASSNDRRVSGASTAATLTPRQREVAEMVASGMSNKEIAARLVISLRTAEGHVEAILTKLDFTTRAQIATWIAQQSPPT
jgi:predicted ATPase/DNA-binding CsgD family transcriptional regulator